MRAHPDDLTVLLLVAVGRALALVLLVLVATTALHGPVPGLALTSVSQEQGLLIETPDHTERAHAAQGHGPSDR